MKTRWLAALAAIALCCGSAHAQSQNFPGGSGGASSPSSLTTYFNKFYGLAPEDYGAFGDVKWCYDGNITSGQTAFTSTIPNQTITNTALTNNVALYTVSVSTGAMVVGQNVSITGSTNGGGIFNVTNQPISAVNNGTQFSVVIVNANVGSAADTGTVVENCARFSAADVTVPAKVIDIVGAGTAGVTYHGTITGFSSATGVTVSPAAGATVTAAKFLVGHDDTTAVQNWCAAISVGNGYLASGLKAHQGYLTKWYYITQPCRIINAIGSNGFTQQGFGSPEPFNSASATESLGVFGTGGLNSGFAMAPQGTFNFGCPVTLPNTNMGVFYYKLWNGVSNNNWGIVADSGSTYNTTACTGQVALYLSDLNGHDNSNNMEIEFAHNTTNTFQGDNISGNCFESHRRDMVIYNNDLNGTYGTGVSGGTGSTFEQCLFDGMVWEGWKGAYNVGFFAVSTNAGQASGRVTNSRIIDSGQAGTGGEVPFASTFSTPAGDCFIIENTDIASTVAGNYDIATNASATGCLRLSNVNLINTASTASTNLISNGGGMNISWGGGTAKCSASCVNGIANTSGSFTTVMDVVNQGGFVGVSGTGASSVALGFLNLVAGTTGWTGTGAWGSSALIFQGTQTLPTGTGACATITTNTGGASGGQATCTGTTGASTFVITPGSTAAHGWVCFASDQTTAANVLRQSANNATTCTIAGTVNANDVLTFGAFAY